MEIDDILEILFNGQKEEIKRILKEQKVAYSFSKDLKAYTIEKQKDDGTIETVRGNKCHYEPNCIKYFGNMYKYEEES